MPPKLLTVKDLAALFQKDEETIRCWIREGTFPSAFKVKDGWYVPIGDIKKLMKKPTDPADRDESKPARTPRHPAGFVTGWK